LGSYVGAFQAEKFDQNKKPKYNNRINISIDSIRNDVLFGHSVVAGNSRSFIGTLTKHGSDYRAIVKEPGNDKYDGSFDFFVDPRTEKMAGRWHANDPKIAVTERSFNLSKTTFTYRPELNLNVDGVEVYDTETDEGVERITEDAGKINASTTLLKAVDIENMYKRDLEVMRNAIYARHGYSFKNRVMRDFFDNYVSWYVPVSTNVSSELTEIERKNITLIKTYEDYADSYYDVFGR
jgi:hypothetical protein